MNSVSPHINNYLVIPKSNDYVQELYKLCLEKVKVGLLVLMLTSTTFDFSELSEKLDISRAELKRFIVINYTKINDVSKKLMDLHDWTLLPSLVVVDISAIISSEMSTVSDSSTEIMQSVTLCAASLINYLHTASLQKVKQLNHGKEPTACIDGFFIVQSVVNKFGVKHLTMLKDLYFYKCIVVEDVKVLAELLRGKN